jgi:hypothetical protein
MRCLKRMVSHHAVREAASWLERADPPQSEKATPTLSVVQAIPWNLGWEVVDGPSRPVCRHEVALHAPGRKGFAVLPHRWVVERSFGWLTHRSGLLRDRAGRLDVAAARMACADVLASTEALIDPGWTRPNRLSAPAAVRSPTPLAKRPQSRHRPASAP